MSSFWTNGYGKFIWKYGGSKVKFVCQNDNWKEHIMNKNDYGEHFYIMSMKPGAHEYKFVVDGQYCYDESSKIIDNVYGTKNNVVCFPEDIDKYPSFKTPEVEDIW